MRVRERKRENSPTNLYSACGHVTDVTSLSRAEGLPKFSLLVAPVCVCLCVCVCVCVCSENYS